MRLPLTVALSLLIAVGALGLNSDCTPGSTTVLVTDCRGVPVEGAQIDIKVCCGRNASSSAVTESHGLATFGNHINDICRATVKFAGFSPTAFGSGSCTRPDRYGHSNCTVEVCKR
ncbi:MAG TPA: hypothetical protein VN776_11825 [Terracidiphilus sp.]|nr:hypothetical protein [Terracidiphilus sp.]